ncbi:MAG: hypothetical protein H6741_06080 [Alphaproteobacteria bacterium]|nr:hypothetical protein [Alphaproteobacteria bacterium]MCB9792277.1 hypothetical protein [Alphaproteobacteria bacterium]
MKKPLALAALAAFVPLVVYAGADASNFKKENDLGANYWNAQAAIDGNLETAWMVPGESVNLGEWIRMDVPKGKIDKIAVMPGWAKSEETFKDYARVKKILVEVWCCGGDAEMKSTGTAHIELEDKMEMQVIDIEDLKVGNEAFGGKIKLSVVEVYEGRDFPNLAVSEVLIHMEESFDARIELDSTEIGEDDPNLLLMLDEDIETSWRAPAKKAAFKVSGNGFGLSTVYFEHAKDKKYARVKKVELSVAGRSIVSEIPDTKGKHPAAVPAVFGYTGSATDDVTIKVLEVWGEGSELAIGELTAKATNFDELAAF